MVTRKVRLDRCFGRHRYIKLKNCFDCGKPLINEKIVYSRTVIRNLNKDIVKYYCEKCYKEIYEGVNIR